MNLPTTQQDARCREMSQVRLAQQGDRQALGWLYDTYAARLYQRVLFPLLAEAAAAEDALSETFHAAFRNLGNYTPAAPGIYPWLAAIARNKAMDIHRARARSGRALLHLKTLSAVGQEPSPEELLEGVVSQQQQAEAVQECLSLLNERYRHAIVLRFFEQLPREVCAERLGVKLGTFDVILLRALRAFRKVWPSSWDAPIELGTGAMH